MRFNVRGSIKFLLLILVKIADSKSIDFKASMSFRQGGYAEMVPITRQASRGPLNDGQTPSDNFFVSACAQAGWTASLKICRISVTEEVLHRATLVQSFRSMHSKISESLY